MTQPGTVLGGRYELDQIIGRGGMAEVWRGRDTRLSRDVAIKRLRADLASDPTFQARFRREAQSAAGLNHPNIVAVYDTGEEKDPASDTSIPYIVMELVEGVTLRDVLRDGRRIVPERALEFTAGVLEALAYSHRAGIVHRDIKPANVMLTPAGTVKVMDFGIARAVADTSATMTQTAAVIGTAQYLSPEQARGEKVDNRSDLYSVGCLLYELLVSQPPFTGDSPVSVAYQHVREAPTPPSQKDPEISAAMDAIVLKALAKAPADRYQDAREMREDIQRALDHQPVHAVAPVGSATAATTVLPNGAAGARRAAATTVLPTDELSEETQEETEEEPKSRRGVVILWVLAGLVLVGMLVALYLVFNPPTPEVASVQVPRVTGETEEAASNTLLDAELEPKVVYVESEEADKGRVITQDPEGGEVVDVGTEVTLSVGQGPDQIKVPDVTGKTEDEARSLLNDAGITNVTTEQADPAEEPIDAEAGNVTVTSPAAGADIAPGGEVKLTIATGRSIVPNLSGMTEDEAKDTAGRAGFELDITTEETADHPEGKVFQQDPQNGDALDREEPIKVTIAAAATTATVPNLLGLSKDEAQAAANGFTLTFTEEESSNQEVGTVIGQDPPSGEQRDRGSSINVTIAVASSSGQVPGLVGLSRQEAEVSAGEAGFRVNFVEEQSAEPEGTVIGQDPREGSTWDLSEPITVFVAVP
ncbi:MAG: Stk1 family PASTA domain-containing Ser/Thr kinase [Arachnia sp.]